VKQNLGLQKLPDFKEAEEIISKQIVPNKQVVTILACPRF
jgi:hypothetical protein